MIAMPLECSVAPGADRHPSCMMYDASLRVPYYLHHNNDLGLCYEACTAELSGMSYSDWAVPYSTSGYVFHYMQAAISWCSKRQALVALSSCEAEIVALSEASKETAHLRRFLSKLGDGPLEAISLSTDNGAARDLAYNPKHHEKTKHIERRHVYVRDLVEDNCIVVPCVSRTANMADFLTKPLAVAEFYRHRSGDSRASVHGAITKGAS